MPSSDTGGSPARPESRLVPGFPGYAVDADGRFWSCHRPGVGGRRKWRPLALHRGSYRGKIYWYVQLYRDDPGGPAVKYNRRCRAMAALAFLGPKPAGHRLISADGDPLNHRPDNLKYLGGAELKAHNRRVYIERLGRATLTPEDAVEIRVRYANGERDLKKLLASLSSGRTCTPCNARHIIKGKTYKEAGGPTVERMPAHRPPVVMGIRRPYRVDQAAADDIRAKYLAGMSPSEIRRHHYPRMNYHRVRYHAFLKYHRHAGGSI